MAHIYHPPTPAPPPAVAGLYPDVAQRVSPNAGGAFATPPDMLVIHYTAGGNASGALATFANRARGVSAHFVVGRDGWLCQCVRLTRQAWHAGRSQWQDRPRLTTMNSCSVGIELVNWGPLTGAPGAWQAWPGTAVPDGEVAIVPQGAWHCWPDVQLAAVESLCRRLSADLPIRWVLGHDEIAPRRKVDPGPAFPLNRLRRALGLPAIGTRR